MEHDHPITSPPSYAVLPRVEYDKLHISNIQLLASIDCALALITIIFDLRQLVIVAIEGVPEDKANVQRTDSDDDESFYIRLILAAVASVGLTLTQLLLACLMMVTLSYGEEERSIQRNTYIVSAIWALWSTVLLIVLIVYASSITTFVDFGDKFYLFMLVSEIVLRVCIILYTSLFFGCQCFKI